ncbi:MAG: hypothetical protein LQ340_003240 [Diploschistes diacapsis]|nr:MAG: hypothetical protein LQ340_003240 [Diploschistes diacapsis]
MSELSATSSSSENSNDPLISSTKEVLGSPLPSPGLLALPSSRKRQRAQTLRILRMLLHTSTWALIAGFLFWGLTSLFSNGQPFRVNVSYLQKIGDSDTLIHNEALPLKALPIAVTDGEGNSRWTISIPPYEDFPLKPGTYADLCGKSHDLAHHLDMIRNGHAGHYGYYHVDNSFMDVSEAEKLVFLPPGLPAHHASVVPGSGVASNGDVVVERYPVTGVCKRSLTYVLESTDAGFGAALMGLWLAYGLAMKEGRAFFVDDREWVYGTYTKFFAPPPTPSCLPPPETERLPCPHHAAHLLVSAATTHWTFGHAFNEEFEDPRGMEVQRQKPIFALMRAGFEALFQLAASDAEYVDNRLSEIEEKVQPGMSVGVHVRRGDKKPYEPKYAQKGEYVPSVRFVDVANDELLRSLLPDNRTEFELGFNRSRMVLASDDPAVYDEWEFRGQERAQLRVVLATGQHDTVNISSYPDWEGEKVHQSWEGGFDQRQFWKMPSSKEGGGWAWGADPAVQERQLMARAYLLDLAVVSRMDRVVCTVSSAGCRLLAVMMGWDTAIEKGRWINVDGDWDWKGIRWS